ncbi:hypothetical protein Tsubulata_013217 [Turnera subulata]|uniref:Uncharacterized protein n=1 Tax=Turnera subulata TaxID=218843 RepID=A0A9Q0FMS6_9ROSI|nr:hypothetical protein Tsubulata_013217 [Turnera subulata]
MGSINVMSKAAKCPGSNMVALLILALVLPSILSSNAARLTLDEGLLYWYCIECACCGPKPPDGCCQCCGPEGGDGGVGAIQSTKGSP